MSLDWNISKCRDVQQLMNDDTECKITDCIIWGTILFGLGHIDEKNVGEWEWRLAYAEHVGEHYWYEHSTGTPVPWQPSRADIERRVGLSTNATTQTRKQWLGKMHRIIAESVTRHIRNKKEEDAACTG